MLYFTEVCYGSSESLLNGNSTDIAIGFCEETKRKGMVGPCIRAVQYHFKFAYHYTIVRVSRYTLGIDTSNVQMINHLHKTARTPHMLRCNFIRDPMQRV